jgi:hypothetical protein
MHEPAREQERGRVSPVGGPSFLGLGDDRTNDLDYLLEEEPPRTHGRMYLALLLLVLSAGLLAWHWQRDGYPWTGLAQSPATSKVAPASPPETAPTATAPTPGTADPAPAQTQPSQAAPGTVSGTAAQTTTGDGAQPVAAQPSTDNAVSPSPITVVKPPDQATPSADGADPVDNAAKPSVAAPQAQDSDAPPAASVPLPKERPAVPVAPPAPVQKPAVAKPAPTFPTVSPEDRLVDEGERYLYGRGVRADCALAQRNLMIGARQSNPKAQTLLGAMYATGHCVGRDLPTAYRWFAKALHGDPSNSRVQRDLEVLWKQMTPEERQLAMKSQ